MLWKNIISNTTLVSSLHLDWEYPGFEDHSGTPQDRENFKLLLNDVRARLDELGTETGRFYGLTAGESFKLYYVCAHLMHKMIYIGIVHILILISLCLRSLYSSIHSFAVWP